MTTSTSSRAAIAALAVLASACSTTSIRTRVQLPPRAPAMREKQKLIVVPFAGPRGPAATSYLESAVRRAQLHELVPQSSPQLATAIVRGNVTPDSYTSSLDRKESTQCVAHDKKGRCTKNVKVPIVRLNEACRMFVTVLVKRVADDQVLLQRTIPGAAEDQSMWGAKPPSPAPGPLCQGAYQRAVEEASKLVTSYAAEVELDLRDVSDETHATSQAMQLVRAGRFADARKLLAGVVSEPGLDDSDRAGAYYNLATIDWTLGAYEECLKEVELAEQLHAPAHLVTAARVRCREGL